MTPRRLRIAIVDDEEPARELLRSLLVEWGEVDIVGEYGDGALALQQLPLQAPDVVFLDVQMPGLTGLEVASALVQEPVVPLIVFVTAFDQYAVQAFEVNACDYLLKPFDGNRLAATMRQVLSRTSRAHDGVIAALRQFVGETGRRSDTVVVKVEGRHLFLSPDEIDWVEAVGKDVRIHVGTGPVTARESMSSMEARLDPATFVRVHRSAIVNRNQIREMQPWFKGDYVIILRKGARIVSGRTYRSTVQRLLKGPDVA
jgi:two-component system LytT family response regulator